MSDLFESSIFAGVTISLLAYMFGSVLKKKLKIAILNPLLVSIIVTIVVLVVADVDYDVYKVSELVPHTGYSVSCNPTL